ncbi:MAG: methylenetetrahydrofolate reductase [NAD(P)H] [Legionellales bacterium]|nr:methylenetetrahydrofolate reductase [NAD(P)H] [Legionellales bacterium]
MPTSWELSFEFFPPRTPVAQETLQVTLDKLNRFNPDFYSVTFGAGGSQQDATLETIKNLQPLTHATLVPHISCINIDENAVQHFLTYYRQLGIQRIVVLRGDLPSGQLGLTGRFKQASDLVNYIREHTQDYFKIYVAAYPEMHPNSQNPQMDIQYFIQKMRQGADCAITQYFFNIDAYCYFRDRCHQLGMTKPIIPGIMPITHFQGLKRFSQLCGADIPKWIYQQLEYYQTDQQALQDFGHEVITRLCQHLIREGAPGLHFYTLNKANACVKILTEFM